MAQSFGKVTGRLSEAVSRRGFVLAVGKAVLGLGAAGMLASMPSTAAATGGTCCSGPLCDLDKCPTNTTAGATSYCCLIGTGYYACYGCYKSGGEYVCTVSNYLHAYCPNTP